MKCSKCGEELNEKWAVCPFCGTEIPKPQTPKSIGEFLASVVEDYGPSIFKEENSNRLERIMSDFPESVADDRDIIKLLQIKNIPDKLSSALDLPSKKQGSVVQECSNILCDKFGINGEKSAEMISLITNAIGLKIDKDLAGSKFGTFTDPRDGQVYKTVKIGNQVWMAENLRYKCVGEENGKYLPEEAARYCPVKGWKMPSDADFETLINYAKENGCGDTTCVLMAKGRWKCNVTPTDDFGFAAIPTWGTTAQFCGSPKDSYRHFWELDITPNEVKITRTGFGGLRYSVRLIKEDESEDKSS